MEIAVNYEHRGQDVEGLFDVGALARLVLEQEHVPESSEVSISFVSDEAIHELNRDYRGVDRPTDVLSFECDGAADAFGGRGALPAGAPFELGDVFVAVDVAERQAPGYGMEFADEVSLLVTHGLLHLCGYDHMADEEAQAMERREADLLSQFWSRPFKRHGFEG